MSYSAEISRANPTCFLFLIDQSRSMLQPIAGAPGKTKAEAVAESINHLLYNLVLRCVWGSSILDRFHVGVFGYGASVGPSLGGALAGKTLVPVSEIARNPLRVEQRVQRNPGTEQSVRFPIWFEPTGDGNTPMADCFAQAGAVLAGFLAHHPDCFPPIVINITDGRPTGVNPEPDANRLRQLSSTDGDVLLFNLHISEQSEQCIVFPDNESELPDAYARFLFRISSPLPGPLLHAASESRRRVSPATRGFVFNGDLDTIIHALDIGTRVSLANRS